MENAVNRYPAVEESAVIASPTKGGGDLVKAIIVLKSGFAAEESLADEIKSFVKTRLSKHEYPKEIEFLDKLPKTPDGKIKRKPLKERERSLKG